MRTRLLTVAGVCLILAASNLAGQPQVQKPIVHLLAPPASTPQNWDLLVEETAQRLVAAELAARYGLFAQYWAVDQIGGMPADAFPRIEIECEKRHVMRHLRLVRKQDTFTFLGSDDGKEYILLGQWSSSVPANAFAGVYVETEAKESGVKAVFTNVRLNGREFGADCQHVQIGKAVRPGTVQREANKWTIRTAGGKTPEGVQCGFFLYAPVEGDFVLDAVLETFERKGNDGWAGPMCRAGLETDSAYFSTWGVESANGGTMFEAGWQGNDFLENLEAHVAKVIFRSGPNERKEIGQLTVSSASWDDLWSSTAQVSKIIRDGIVRELKLDLAHPAEAISPRASDIEKLERARAEALSMNSGSVLRASEKINEVLDGTPTCPEAHYSAALCGSLLACQDLYGCFHERGRFLAGPLSHMMLARSLAEPRQPQETLASAWVMLACGYPDAALSVLESLTAADRQQPEAKALEMFVTRDYRPLTTETVLQATPVEQLAWLWATQETGRTDLLLQVPQKIAVKAGTPAFLPLCVWWFDVGAGHVHSAIGPVLSCTRDIADLLTCEAIPANRRAAAASKLNADLGVQMDTNAHRLQQSLIQRLTRGDTDEDILPAIPIVMDLYEAAMTLPAGPVKPGVPLRWQCLNAHDFAELQRGLMLLNLYRRTDFVGSYVIVYDQAYKLCQRISAGLTKFPEAAEFFRAASLPYVSKHEEGKPIIISLLKKPFGKLPSVVSIISSRWADWYPELGNAIWLGHCRGSWEISSVAEAASKLKNGHLVLLFSTMALEADNHAGLVLSHWIPFWGGDLQWLQAYLARMPYDFQLLRSVASDAERRRDTATAERGYKRLIELAPGDVSHYNSLAQLYASSGQNAKAIEIAQLAVKKCPDTVHLSVLMGRAAIWLVKEGRPEEALKMGRVAAESYSTVGLEGLAVALAANGKMDEALATWRATAHRYEGTCGKFVQFLLENNYPDEKVVAEIESCLNEYPAMRDSAVAPIASMFEDMPAKYKVLERVYAGPLSFIPAATQKYNLARMAMYSRHLEDAISYLQQIEHLRALEPQEVLMGCLMGKLLNKKDVLESFMTKVPTHLQHYQLGPCMQYLAGQLPAAQLLEKSPSPYAAAFAHDLLGVQAEVNGDLAAALVDYQAAAAISTPYYSPTLLGKSWAAAVEEKLKGSKQPEDAKKPAAK